MNRVTSVRLMTIEEAQGLSDLQTSHETEQRRKMWAWQSVGNAMAQTISDEQIDHMEALSRRK